MRGALKLGLVGWILWRCLGWHLLVRWSREGRWMLQMGERGLIGMGCLRLGLHVVPEVLQRRGRYGLRSL